MGLVILFLQSVLAARLKWVSRPYGFDMVIRYHKYMAGAALFFLLLHPVLLAAGGAGWQLLLSAEKPSIIWLGRAALFLLLLNAVVSVYQGRLNIKFEKWRIMHNVIVPVILLAGFVHARFTGHDLAHLFPLRTHFLVLLVIAFAVFVYHRFIRPARLARTPHQVVEVLPETKDVWTVKMRPPEGTRHFDYLPGQFQFITFRRGRDLPVEEHHWTISSSPTQNFISATIKVLGDFTATIGATRPGDEAVIHAPFGRFSYALHPEEKQLVFIAGGIGVTPLMSMLRHMRDSRKDISVLFFYANKNEADIVFRKELDEIASGEYPRLRLVHVLEEADEGWQGEKGVIDQDMIKRYCDPISGLTFYLCGPPGLIESNFHGLQSLGVEDRQIRLELFTFL
ncbi:ferredoxin reductase family protein [Desulfatitalea alkaliphila]|uniref:Ferredoxin reductase family protein n=1 Tax=Desulfatitalea alkaliphila TaxID=2929485 RepID=A0AA41QY19_9BACT|nr:ferredoxin reductase family protein [Desulfatitalea alkaliphila]MCJ8499037.1 ferredoxin reductase family protein [Desulfatitalea alkaliphila]